MDHEAQVFRRTIIAMISALNGGGTGILQDGVFSVVARPSVVRLVSLRIMCCPMARL